MSVSTYDTILEVIDFSFNTKKDIKSEILTRVALLRSCILLVNDK